MKYRLQGMAPRCEGDNYIAPNAAVIGDVVLEQGASVWFSATLRADNATITIGERSNIQDGSVCHSDEGFPLVVGRNVTVGHQVMLHGCTIEDECLIGIHATILNGAVIGKGSIIGANALVTEGTIIPPRSLVLGSPAKVVKSLPEGTTELLEASATHYLENNRRFMEYLEEVK